MREEIAEQQADITRLLLHHIQRPLGDAQYIRGVLPAPAPAQAVRVITGHPEAFTPDNLIAYEFPLLPEATGYDILGLLRTLVTGTHAYPSHAIGTMMGMTLVRVAPDTVKAAPFTWEDNALTLLHTLADPYTEEQPDPRLLGFHFRDQDRMRLYFHTADFPGVIAADVQPSGAVTALLAALPSLITEEERMAADDTDPHCSHVVDLTTW